MYFVIAAPDDWSGRLVLSLNYRLFDPATGFGAEQPWLVGFYFGFTQSSLSDLSAESKPFHDTSYRPSLFWERPRSDERTSIDAERLGFEHGSDGDAPPISRSSH